MFPAHSHADPPQTLAQRLDRLNDTLQSLGQQLKDAIAGAIGSAVAGTVRDAIRGLLGPSVEPSDFRDRLYRNDFDDRGWDDPDQPRWPEDEDYPPLDRHEPPRRQLASRWSNAVNVGLQAGLCWLRQPKRRPVLTAVVVAVAAGLAALLAGPAIGAGAGVLASTAGLLLTADALGPNQDQRAGFPTG